MALTINHQTNDISATSGSVTIDGSAIDVGAATAGLSAGGIGTYCFANGPDTAFGSTTAGSGLTPISAMYKGDEFGIQGGTGNGPTAGSALSGTWRCMGTSDATWVIDPNGANPDTIGYGATLWLRIS
jgi:hypothetical protein